MKRLIPYRWLRVFIWALLLVAVIWTAVWFAASQWLDNKVGDITTSLSNRGTEIECANRTVSGFPFSMKVNCEKLGVVTVRGTERADFGALSTGASVFSPDVITSELKAPFITYAGGKELRANWSSLQAKVDANLQGGFDEFLLRSNRLNLSRDGLDVSARIHMMRFKPVRWTRKTDVGNTSLNFGFSTKQLALKAPNGVDIPPADIRGVAILKDGYRDLVDRRLPIKTVLSDGANVRLANLVLSLEGGGKLGFSGPIRLSEDGLISGKVRMGISEPKSIGAWASRIDPNFQQAVAALAQATAGMGKTSKIGGNEMKTISVNIKRGEVRLGFIKLGKIPPVKFD
jgi:hypothetical protein